MKARFLYSLFFIFTLGVAKQSLASNSALLLVDLQEGDSIVEKKNFWNKEVVKIAFVPTVFFGSTAATNGARDDILQTRNRYIPEFSNTFDDYLQYGPGALAFGLKAGGVQGRNNMKRSVYNYLGSMVIMGIFVNSLKYSTKVMRPDNSKANSWPSGHAATAFANAAFLDKEYGMVNPGYSITGYSMAVLTGVGRSMNNRHWSSDILAGAGFGILSTNLAYFFIDKIYGNKGDNLSVLSRFTSNGNPSFLSVKMGASFSSVDLLDFHRNGPEARIGWEAGFEGAYFFSPRVGVGLDFTTSGYPLSLKDFEGLQNDVVLEEYKLDYTSSALGFLNIAVGPYYNLELWDSFNLTLKGTFGYAFGAAGKLEVKQMDKDIELPQKMASNLVVATYKPHGAIRLGFGAAFTYDFTSTLGISLYGDYAHSKPTFFLTPENPLLNNSSYEATSKKTDLHYVALGVGLKAYF
ncbi:phosphatase PAP2 family protein [Myroides sp. LJL116]